MIYGYCKHDIQGAKYHPYPDICQECAKDFIKYCQKNNIEYNKTLFATTEQMILDEQKALEAAQKARQLDKHKKRLEHYKNAQNLTNEEIGKRYERYIGYIYEWIYGYDVTFNGILKAKEDEGIDLIVKNKEEIILIQCKMWSKDKIMYDNIVARIGFAKFLWQNKFKNQKIRAMLIIQNDNLDDKSQELCKEAGIEYNSDIKYDPDYPMIKCNVTANGKIYHLPNDPSYDTIKINKNKGEYYVYTTQEAEALGFREQLVVKKAR